MIAIFYKIKYDSRLIFIIPRFFNFPKDLFVWRNGFI